MITNKNWILYVPVFTWNFPVLIMLTTQLLADARPFNMNKSDSSDLNNYNFNFTVLNTFFTTTSNFWPSLKCSYSIGYNF